MRATKVLDVLLKRAAIARPPNTLGSTMNAFRAAPVAGQALGKALQPTGKALVSAIPFGRPVRPDPRFPQQPIPRPAPTGDFTGPGGFPTQASYTGGTPGNAAYQFNTAAPSAPAASVTAAPASAAPAVRHAPASMRERQGKTPEELQAMHEAWAASPEYQQMLAKNYALNNAQDKAPEALQPYMGAATAALNKERGTPAQAATAASPSMATTAALNAPAATPPLAGKPS